jgi:hypothetical protein
LAAIAEEILIADGNKLGDEKWACMLMLNSFRGEEKFESGKVTLLM